MIAALLMAAAFTVPPTPTHYVTDTAGALSESTRADLENELRSYEKVTGHQAIVWIGKTTGDTVLEDWTSQTAHEWKVGRKGKDDGVILFLFMDDHKVRIEVGYGLEGPLPDATASQIIRDDILPAMRRGDVDGAVRTGAERIMLTITPDFRSKLAHPPSPASESTSSGGAGSVFMAVFWLIFALVIIFLPITLIIIVMVAAIRGGKGGKGSGWVSSGGWSSGSSFSSSSSSFDSGFSAGGGDFGGGGASGSW